MTNLCGADLGVPDRLEGESGAIRKLPSLLTGDAACCGFILDGVPLGLTEDIIDVTDPRRDDMSDVDPVNLAAHLMVW